MMLVMLKMFVKTASMTFRLLPDTPSGPGAVLCQCFSGLAVADFVGGWAGHGLVMGWSWAGHGLVIPRCGCQTTADTAVCLLPACCPLQRWRNGSKVG